MKKEPKPKTNTGYVRRLVGFYEEYPYAMAQAKKNRMFFSQFIRHLINEHKKSTT